MQQFDQWMFPDHEAHLQKWMTDMDCRKHGRLTYQAHKYAEAVHHTPSRRTAIDVGAHVGLWSFLMAHDFERVQCFEPMAAHAECWRVNMADMKNAKLYDVALGAAPGLVSMQTTEGSSGDTRIAGDGDIVMRTIDSYAFDDVDFIKIDCEGYELRVLEGAIQTLERCKPTVVVEQKRDMSERFGITQLAAVELLKDIGAFQITEMGGDHILRWR